jgi:hypothetical protein
MLASHSVVRRFTPPTCTLEIWAKNSPLSRWTNRQVLKDLRFQLSFDDPRMPAEKQLTINGDRRQLEQLSQAVTNYVQNFLQQSSKETDLLSLAKPKQTTQPLPSIAKPYLQPLGLVAHQLFFGSLSNDNSVAKIKLSALQLFDLATALDEYNTEIAALPELNLGKKRRILPLWASNAAVALLAVGLTTAAIQIFNQFQSTTSEVATSQKAQQAPINHPEIVDVIPPKVPEAKPNSTKQPQLKEPLSSLEKLPPPPPVDLPKPPPANVPDPAKYPFLEPIQIPQPRQPETAITIKPDSAKTESATASSSQADSESQPQTQASQSQSATSHSFAIESQQKEDNPQLPDLSTSEATIPTFQTETAIAKKDQSSRLNQPTETERANTNIAATEDKSTSELVQVKEIKEYFQQRWQPPKELKQTLEYRLVVNFDGSIKQITPLGKASEIYLDRTNIPLMGESFVSPLKQQANLTIRLLLSPDGQIRTFLERK